MPDEHAPVSGTPARARGEPGSGRPATGLRHTNRLAAETSPYLLQHKHNPVDWYPWGAEALARARTEQRPIFLSIGYAACHWCHVMERESFEDDRTAAFLNEHFVAVKVDREERPDLDAIYMDAVQLMTGQGGWPMSVFLTPDGKPFYGGTYFPGESRYGMPSFRDVLEGVANAWATRREEVEGAGSRLVESIDAAARASGRTATEGSAASTAEATAGAPTEGAAADGSVRRGTGVAPWMLDAAMVGFERGFDARNGGWGGAPKFPQPMAIEALLREHLRTGDPRPLAMARRTLDAMAAGGIRDHLGGGFARYATDAVWLVPHFEKMLYDNALLARVYLHAFQLTGDPSYRRVTTETLDFVARELRVPADGAFASSLDADTDGEEGATYVWDAAEVREVLGDEAGPFMAAYGVTDEGNWEGRTILSRIRHTGAVAAEAGLDPAEVERRLETARARLLERRTQRHQPARDDKVLASWNGLMLAPFAEAGRVLDEERYRAIAVRAADFLLHHLRGEDGRLRRSWKDGRATQNGVLEDHTHLADGLLAVYEATFDERWFVVARELMDVVLDHFADPSGGFFDTADDHERLITRPKGLQDNALPSGNAMATLVLLRLAALTGEGRYRSAADRALSVVADVVHRHPTAFSQWIVALHEALAQVDEIAIIGDPGAPETKALVDVAFAGYRPHQVVAGAASAHDSAVPLLHDRPRVDGRATAYVCRGFACRQPVTDPTELAQQLARVA